MKRKTAKDILAESFHELAQRREIDRITIHEITENCGYSPATFYRNFKDKYDLVAWDYTRNVAETMGKIGKDGYEWRQTLLDGALFFQAQKKYLTNLFLHTSGRDAFVFYMIEINAEQLRKEVLRHSGKKTLDKKTELYIRTYCQGTVALTCEWILGMHKITPEELAEVFEKSLPEPLHPYLYSR